MRTPLHFPTSLSFRLYVLECALRDRAAYREAIKCCKDMGDAKRETNREIACIEAEIRRLSARKT